MLRESGATGDPRIEVYSRGHGIFVAHFWDQESRTEAASYYDLNAWGDRPVEERLWQRAMRSTEEQICSLFEGKTRSHGPDHDLTNRAPITDANRRVVPTAAMNRAVSAAGAGRVMADVDRLRLPNEEEINLLIEAIAQGRVVPGGAPIFRNRRDLKGRWRELEALVNYAVAKVYHQDPAPARFVMTEMNLKDLTQARNLIHRARQHGYLSPGAETDEFQILEPAFELSDELHRLLTIMRGSAGHDERAE